MQVGFIGIILQDIHEDVEMIFLSNSCEILLVVFNEILLVVFNALCFQ